MYRSIERRVVHEFHRRRFKSEQRRAGNYQAADREQQPVELALITAGRAIEMRAYEQHRAKLDHELAHREHRVRQADYFDIESVGVVPPVVERRRGEHRKSAPRRHETSERPAKSPYRDARVFGLLRRSESGGQDRVAAGDSSEHAREINHHVRRSPERVAAYRDMPRDVPIATEHVGGGRSGEAPYVPRYRGGALRCDAADVGALAKVEGCGSISHG